MTEVNTSEKNKVIQKLLAEAGTMTGYVIVAYTDDYIIDKWSSDMEINEGKLLDLRVFSEEKEVRIFRTSLGREFHFSVLKDDEKTDKYDEVQILDIAEAQFNAETGKVDIETITAGTYKLSAELKDMKNPGIRIRFYFEKYPGSGRAYIKNWRCVGFEPVTVIHDILKEDLYTCPKN